MASRWTKLPSVVERAYRKSLHVIEGVAVTWENIFEREWDVCIIIDACRYDLFESLSEEYAYIQSYQPFISADSMTPRWMERTFVPEVNESLAQTAYICGNPFGEEWVDRALLGHYEPVYEYGWDGDVGTVHPGPITDAALRCSRSGDWDRLLVHYMQPHVPFVHWEKCTPIRRGNFSWDHPGRADTWAKLRAGEVERDEVRAAYRRNLQYVLDELELLVDNIGSNNAVLTSDHGNGYGEYGIYGHPMHMPFRTLREVPWAKIETADSGTYDPSPRPSRGQQDWEQQLEALGYR